MSRSRLLLVPLAGLSAAFFLLFAAPELSGRFVEGDLASYFLAAGRLIESGSPYQEAYRALAPSVPFWLDWQVYLYTPLMAQLFVPLVGLGFHGAWSVWFVISAVALAIAGILGWRAGGGRVDRGGFILGALLLVGVTPITAGLATGRPEPLAALAVGWALVSERGVIGLALATLLRLTPVPLILPVALASRRPFRAFALFALSGLVALGVAALVAPTAWSDFLLGGVGSLVGSMPLRPEALASLSGAPAPAAYLALSDFMLDPWAPVSAELAARVEPLRLLSWVGAGALLVISLRWGREPGRLHAALAAAMGATFLVPGILWDYHLVPLLPIALASWTAGGRRERALLVGAALIATLIPLELARSGGVFPTWWHLISLPIAACVLEAARTSRLPRSAD
jgi:hypothetical protein